VLDAPGTIAEDKLVVENDAEAPTGTGLLCPPAIDMNKSGASLSFDFY